MRTAHKTTLVAVLALLVLTALLFVTDPFTSDEPVSRRDTGRPLVPNRKDEPGEPEPPKEPDRNLDLHGIVVNDKGQPVAGAKVATLWDPWRRARMGDPGKPRRIEYGPESVSGTDGQFALRLRRGQRVDLRVSAAGFAVRELGFLQAGERIRIVMAERCSICGASTPHASGLWAGSGIASPKSTYRYG